MSMLAWADVHARTVGETCVIAAGGDSFVTVKMAGLVNVRAIDKYETDSSMSIRGDATLFLSIPAAREMAHALLAATEPAPALSEVA